MTMQRRPSFSFSILIAQLDLTFLAKGADCTGRFGWLSGLYSDWCGHGRLFWAGVNHLLKANGGQQGYGVIENGTTIR